MPRGVIPAAGDRFDYAPGIIFLWTGNNAQPRLIYQIGRRRNLPISFVGANRVGRGNGAGDIMRPRCNAFQQSRRCEMTIQRSTLKGLLLGSAAGLIAVAGAQAADLPVKARPVQYVKVCTLYGDGYYYIPGSDT